MVYARLKYNPLLVYKHTHTHIVSPDSLAFSIINMNFALVLDL